MKRKQTAVGVAGSTNRNVDVLLAEDVETLGKQGDIVRVKPGYARNFLLPNGLATIATEHNKRMVQRHQLRVAELQKQRLKQLKQLADNVSKYSVTLEANANKEGHLYGSVVANDISGALKSASYAVEPDHVMLEGPLKELGMYTIKISLDPEVQTEVKVWVVPASAKEPAKR
jgi:large subunit ribosomal protein L9